MALTYRGIDIQSNEEYNHYPNETGNNVFTFRPESHLIGLHTQFLNDLEQFNREFNIDLECKKTFHWKNGMYDRIRTKTTELILPYLNNKPRGSAGITQHNTHRYNQFRTQLLRLEDEMGQKRWHRYVMGDESDDGFPKWNTWLDGFTKGLSECKYTEYMEIPTISDDFFGRKYRTMADGHWSDTYDKVPRILFTFHLNDLSLNIFKGDHLIAVVPWGNLVVNLEMD